jgi:hypothetical protein
MTEAAAHSSSEIKSKKPLLYKKIHTTKEKTKKIPNKNCIFAKKYYASH